MCQACEIVERCQRLETPPVDERFAVAAHLDAIVGELAVLEQRLAALVLREREVRLERHRPQAPPPAKRDCSPALPDTLFPGTPATTAFNSTI